MFKNFSRIYGLVLCAVLFFGLYESANAAAVPVLYAVNNNNNHLISFRADNPSVLLSDVAISGLLAGFDEDVRGIDFRPSTGQLYLITTRTVSGHIEINLYTVNPLSGAATYSQASPREIPNITATTAFGVDFNPANDNEMRTVSDTRLNLRTTFDNSGLTYDTTLAYAAGDPSAGTNAKVAHIAYNNNRAGAAASTLYGIDFQTDKLVRIGGVGGNPSANGGQLTTVGALGFVTTSIRGGFDIQADTNDAYAVLNVGSVSRLHRVNLSTGAATAIGNVGNNLTEIDGLAIAPAPTLFDFDGDFKADVSVFRFTTGTWYLQQSTNGFTGAAFGQINDQLVPADYDGDGKTDIAVFRAGTWYIQRSRLGFTGVAFGASNDFPAPGDYDGDGIADIAVYRNNSGTWYIQGSQAGFYGVAFGQPGDRTVQADYDGDGKTDIAVNRGGAWYLQRSSLGFTAVTFGDGSDKTVPADYDGDGKADIAVFRPSTGTWYIQRSLLGFTGAAFGTSTDRPVPADYDGDGKTDIAVFRAGTWYLQRSTLGFTGVSFGGGSDISVPSAYVR